MAYVVMDSQGKKKPFRQVSKLIYDNFSIFVYIYFEGQNFLSPS